MRLALLAALLTLAAFPARGDEVTVFAAASLKHALDDVATDFSRNTGHTLSISYAGSNALATQVIHGAPADVFVSASREWMDEVEKAGLVERQADILGNTLVLVAHGTDVAKQEITPRIDLLGMLNGGKLAMAMVDSVPAGQYGKAALQQLGLWDDLALHVAQSDNVRTALAMVAAGEAPYGIVYATDALVEPGIAIVGAFPAQSHPPITYPGALIVGAGGAGAAFFDAMMSENADVIFQKHGFSVID